MRVHSLTAACVAALLSVSSAIELDLGSEASIKAAASRIAHDMMKWYWGDTPGGIPGLLGAPYYWWEAGACESSLIVESEVM